MPIKIPIMPSFSSSSLVGKKYVNLNHIVLNKVGKYSTFSGKYAAAHCNIFVLLLAIKQDQKVCALAAFAFSVCNLDQYLVYVRLRKKRNVKIVSRKAITWKKFLVLIIFFYFFNEIIFFD